MRPSVAGFVMLAWLFAAPRGSHAEFPVNTYTTSTQAPGAVAASGAGFVVVWGSYEQDGSGYGIFGRRYDAAGVPLGAEFQVNVHTTGDQTRPVVALDAGGGFVVAWSYLLDFLERDVIGRRYDAGGGPLGGEFVVNTYTTGLQSEAAIGMDAGGNFAVVWVAETSAEDNTGIRGQRYDANGMLVGGEFQVNTYTTKFQVDPHIAMRPAGDFVVVWTSADQEAAGSPGIFGQRFDSGGVPQGGEFHVNTSTVGSQVYPGIAAQPGGGFVVTWQDFPNVVARLYDAAGVPLGGEFVVNTYPTGDDSYPTVAGDGVGFVVVWETDAADFFSDLRGQRYDDTGQRLGSEFQVNTYTTLSQRRARVAGDGAGNFVMAWADGRNSYDVFAQMNKPDRLIRGRRLQVRDRRSTESGRRALLFGTESDTEVGPTIDGDPTVHGATLRVIANGVTASDQTYVLDAAGWAIASAGFRYSGPTGGDGDPVKKVLLKRANSGTAQVRVVLNGSIGTQSLDVVPPNMGDDGGLILDIGGGGGRYCVAFGGAAGGTEVQDTATGWRVLSASMEPGCPTP